MNDTVSKSWFAVFNNPQDHGYDGEPHNIVDRLIDEWVKDNPTRTCAMTYCISADGLHHVHMVLEDVKAMRFSAIKKSYAIGAHFEATKGNKEQAESYIKKTGKFQEKGEVVVYANRHGEIKGCQGSRRDLEVIEELINNGYTPSQIMDMSISYRRYEKLIRDAFFSKRNKETPFVRDVMVYWHVGESGSGKSYCSSEILTKRGEDSMYFVSEYENGFLDRYNGEPVLFMDEFRAGRISYSQLLAILDKYKTQIHARYTNVYALWSEVHITSVLPPEDVYKKMVQENQDKDTLLQLKRRINFIIYHWKDNSCNYHQYLLLMADYRNYDELKKIAYDNDGFVPLETNVKVPFD